MTMNYLLKLLNWCFLITGNGSITYNGRKWMYSYFIWRIVLISLFSINVYITKKWVCYIIIYIYKYNISLFFEVQLIQKL